MYGLMVSPFSEPFFQIWSYDIINYDIISLLHCLCHKIFFITVLKIYTFYRFVPILT